MDEVTRERIEAATVRLPDKGGQGVLIPGNLILTAAHCIEWDGEGRMALGEPRLQRIETKRGATFRLDLAAAEPRADIAVLGEPDNQEFPEDSDAFERFCEAVQPVAVSSRSFEREVPVPVHVLTHDRGWVRGSVTRWAQTESGSSSIETSEQIDGGTSGGPVVDDAGELIGVVSSTDEGGHEHNGTMPVAHLALPRWVWMRVEDAILDDPTWSGGGAPRGSRSFGPPRGADS